MKCQSVQGTFCKELSLLNAADSGNTIGEIREGDLMKCMKSKYPESKSLISSYTMRKLRVPVD